MKKLIVLLIITLFCFQVSGQKIRPEIKSLVNKIEKYNVLESEYVGVAGETTEQYRNFEKLRNKATFDELIHLLKRSNSVIKGYASWALADKMYPNLSEILSEFIRTEEKVISLDGCIQMQEELATIFYLRVYYQHFDNELSIKDSLFFQSQIKKLDSVILYTKKPHYLLYEALSNNNGNPKHYDRIRDLAINDKNVSAIEALAIYNKKEDIEDIKKTKELAFRAISKFPDKDFWTFILSYTSSNQSKNYLMAISAFKTKESANLLLEIYTKIEEKNIKYLLEAITKNYCIYYQDLILTIWAKHKMIDINATNQIIKDVPEKSSIYFSEGLLLPDKEYQLISFDNDYNSTEKILPLMLDNIKTYQNNKLIEICKHNIKTAEFSILSQFLSFMKENKLTETDNDILNRLNQKNQAYDIFHLTETILSFNIQENKEVLIKILKSKQTDWDWGNWSKSFRTLIKEYNINIDE